MSEWQPIESAPNHTSAKRILIVGGAWKEPELVLPDGDWWRMRIRRLEGAADALDGPRPSHAHNEGN